MRNQIFISIIICLFLNFIFGCAIRKNVQLPATNLKNGDFVTGVSLSPSEKIIFNDMGGKVILSTSTIQGKIVSGEYKIIPLELVKEVRIKTFGCLNYDNQNFDKITNIKEAVDIHDILFTFKDNGILDKNSNMISGVLIDNKFIELPYDNFKYIYEKTPEIINKENLKNDIKIEQVIYYDNSTETFNDSGGYFKESYSAIVGISREGEPVKIKISEAAYATIEKIDTQETIFVYSVLLGILIILFVTSAKSADRNKIIYTLHK